MENHPEYTHADQDALNILFANKFLKLPRKFNCLLGHLKEYDTLTKPNCEIYHYVSKKFDILYQQNMFQRLWLKYFWRTPFCTEKVLIDCCNFFEQNFYSLNNFKDDKLNLWQKIFQMNSKKSRGFFTYPQNAQDIANFFGYSNEPIINAASENSISTLIENLKSNRFFLIAVDSKMYESIKNQLISAKFVENQDFFNVIPLLQNQPIYLHRYNVLTAI